MSDTSHSINQTIRRVCFFFSFDLLLFSVLAALYTGEDAASVWHNWCMLQISPCPLVTDYFRTGSLAAAFLNAGLCGLCIACICLLHWAYYRPYVWAGFFLVIAHGFYGLNLVNMWPPMLGFLLYCRVFHLRFRDHLDRVMFITSFGPFFSELLFRYPLTVNIPLRIGDVEINLFGVLLCAILAVFVGFALPALLNGTQKLHRGFNLYNGGLATGLLGLFLYAFMYNTMGVTPPTAEVVSNPVYEAHGCSYQLFCSLFFVTVFTMSLIYGWFINGKSFRGYGKLLQDSGYQTNFIYKYGIGLTWINLGVYGLMITGWFNLVICLTDGAGFTGATCGVILAAMTFSASGQHPRNVWPILLGYVTLSLLVTGLCALGGREPSWTLSTQGYLNGLAFATGLCPFVGVYNRRAGVIAGFMSAVMCTTTSVMHGGFVLYNGGLTAGIAALLLLPLLDLYQSHIEAYGRKEEQQENKS